MSHPSHPISRAPVRYSPSVEKVEADECEAIDGLNEVVSGMQHTTREHYGNPVRGLHAKGHGLVQARVTIFDGLPPELAQGLFATPGEHDAVLRISTGPADILDDSISGPRGLALKIFDVDGARLPGSPAEDGQDFVMVNGPAFGQASPAKFLPGLKGLAKTTDHVEGLKKAVSATLQVVEGALETVGLKSSLVSMLGGAPNTHPLGDVYFSQVPYRYGDYIAKFSVAPVSPWLVDLKGDKVNAHGRPDALREDVNEVIGTRGGEWELRVQLCTDLEAMPIEDPTIVWDEAVSPFRPVARIVAAPHPSWQHGVTDREEADLAFSPWHGLTAFQPLGAINRARRTVYEKSQAFRGAMNACPFRHAELQPAE